MDANRLADVRHAVKMFGDVTPAAQIASELLAEVDRLRGLATAPDDVMPIKATADALDVTPRTVQKWQEENARLRAVVDVARRYADAVSREPHHNDELWRQLWAALPKTRGNER